jgi:hypothetical protein
LGSPDVLPIAGWRISDGLAYATSRNGLPGLTDDYPGTSYGPTRLLSQAIQLVRAGDTTDLGHLLAPMGVRYLVMVSSPAPLDTATADLRPIPRDLHDRLQSQLDLQLIDESAAATVYQNDAWAPMRIRLPDGAVGAAQLDDPRVARTVALNKPAPSPVLRHQSAPTTFTGDLPSGSAIEVAEAPSAHWQLRAGGHTASRQSSFGSSNLFSVVTGGRATLRYSTPFGWRVAYFIGAGLWMGALTLVIRGRRRLYGS